MNQQALGTRRFVGRPTTPHSADGGVFVVAAGKGGVGTSTATLLLALAARRHGDVMVVDAQEGFAGIDGMLGVPEPVAEGEGAVHDVVPGLTLVRVPGIQDPAASAAGRRSRLRRLAREAGSPRTVLVDAGARPLGVLHAITDFDADLVTVLGPDTVSSAAAYALAKVVWHHRPDTRVAALVDRADEAAGRLAYDALRSAASRFQERPVEWLGCLADTPTLSGLTPDGWLHLHELEPALFRVAAEAAQRLIPRPAAPATQTLTLLK